MIQKSVCHACSCFCVLMLLYPCQAWPLLGTMLTLILRIGVRLIARLRFGPLILRSTEFYCSTKVNVRNIESESTLAALGSTDTHHSQQPQLVSRQAGQKTAGLHGKHAVTHVWQGFKRQAMQPDLVSESSTPETLANPECGMACQPS